MTRTALPMAAGVLGLVIGCGGIGALAGASVVPVLVRPFDRFDGRRVAIAALLLGGVAQVFIPLAPPDPVIGALFLIASQFIGDGLRAIYMITETSLRQRAIADNALDRAAALWKMSSSIVAPVGMILRALLAEGAGIRAALWVLVGGRADRRAAAAHCRTGSQAKSIADRVSFIPREAAGRNRIYFLLP